MKHGEMLVGTSAGWGGVGRVRTAVTSRDGTGIFHHHDGLQAFNYGSILLIAIRVLALSGADHVRSLI